MTVVWQQRTNGLQWHLFVVVAIVPGQDQPGMASKRRVPQDVLNSIVDAQMHAVTVAVAVQ